MSLIPSEFTTQEDKSIENKKKEEVIRFKTTTDHKEKIERAAEKRGITVSEYLRQSVKDKIIEILFAWYDAQQNAVINAPTELDNIITNGG